MLTEEMKVRAVAIADESMTELLRCHALQLEASDDAFALSDPGGKRVAHLRDADPAIIEAFAWLRDRGLAKLRRGQTGQLIVLTTKAANSAATL